jgi:sugar diacid utilization regulator
MLFEERLCVTIVFFVKSGANAPLLQLGELINVTGITKYIQAKVKMWHKEAFVELNVQLHWKYFFNFR